MKFSIIIPTLNEENYIGVLLESLRKQTYQDFEIIVVDADSQDNTKGVVEGFVGTIAQLTFVISPKKGVALQRNYGATLASSDHLVFMDADTKVEPDFFEKIQSYLLKNDADVLTVKNVPMSDRLFDKFVYFYFCDIHMPIVSKFNPAAIGTFIYITREAFNSVGGFSKDIFIAEDYDLVKRAYRRGYKKYVYLKDPVVYFSVRRFDKYGRFTFLMNQFKGFYYYYFKGGITNTHASKFDFYKDKKVMTEEPQDR